MGITSQADIRMKLEEMGVDIELLEYIDQLNVKEQEGIYHFFLDIMNDELTFVLSHIDYRFTEEYLRKRVQKQPLEVN